MSEKQIRLKIKRQDNPHSEWRWEEFSIAYRPKINILTGLMEIRKYSITVEGKKTSPIVWESSCLENLCGACSMVINDRARQACSTLFDDLDLSSTITIEPLSKFPVIRDLKVDRSKIFADLKRAKAWVEIDGAFDLGPSPRQDLKTQDIRYKLSGCMSCGLCMEVCPQYSRKNAFLGAATINQVQFINLHPIGKMSKEQRLNVMMGSGGVQDCGNAQNCVRVCPREIPLTESIANINRETTWQGILGWLKR
ncbi:MAG: succinate dehydrogenase iron-sulfur subunit [Acidobacteria bacterium]|nr:succinate dehydrogenase iron-sulfur subunit [Acidobacteriota bacterium]